MALKLLLVGSKGQTTEYHRILATSQVYTGDQQGIHINLASYANEEYRNAEKTSGTEMILNNVGIVLPFTDDDFSRATLYARIKTEVAEFNNAEDC